MVLTPQELCHLGDGTISREDVSLLRILAIDIGNTRASFAFFENRSMAWRRDVLTSNFPDVAREILGTPVDACVVSNVARNRAFFEAWIKARFGKRVFCVDVSHYPWPILYSPVESLGHDRLVNALAAHEVSPSGAIVVDMGTATHFDVIAPTGAFMGGPILSGIETMLTALTDRIPHLPEITLTEKPIEPLSQNTRSAIYTGTVLCVAGGIDRIVEEIKSTLEFVPSVILTGGNAAVVSSHIRYDMWIPELTLKGLALYGENMLRKSGMLRATA